MLITCWSGRIKLRLPFLLLSCPEKYMLVLCQLISLTVLDQSLYHFLIGLKIIWVFFLFPIQKAQSGELQYRGAHTRQGYLAVQKKGNID